MIGAYLSTEHAIVAIDGKRLETSFESLADSGTACHTVVPINAEVASISAMLNRLQQQGLSVQAFHDAAAFASKGPPDANKLQPLA